VCLPLPGRSVALTRCDIIRALANFRGPIALHVYFYAENPKLTDFVLTRSVYRELLHKVLDERERLGYPRHRPFEVGFTVVQDWKWAERRPGKPEYRLGFLESGEITFEDLNGPRLSTASEMRTAMERKHFKMRCALHRKLRGKDTYRVESDEKGNRS
jgi:hypothetical protein